MHAKIKMVYANWYKRCGMYITPVEPANQRQGQLILAPLITSEYHLEISNAITNVTLTQTYKNPSQKFLQMEYSFPVDPQACIYKFSAQFGTTRIEGVIKEKEEAKKQYKEAIEQGKKAAYGQLNPESKDILNLKVGNVPPNTSVKIEIAYLQELSLSCNTFYQLHMSSTISPRYLADMPVDVFRHGFRNEAAKQKGQFYWNFRINLRTSRKVTFFDSHTHDIEVLSQNDSKTLSQFAMTKASVPNKDFTFIFTTENFQLPSSVFGRTDAGSTAMLSFIPKFCDLSLDDAYKASVIGKSFETDIDNARGEYIFLLDRSGSMSGKRIKKAKQALILFIKSLPQDTYFNVVSFGNRSENMFPKSVRYSDKQVNTAVKIIKDMTACFGGTQIYTPLNSLITSKPIDGYPKQIFLLTDGCVSNTDSIVNMVALNNKYSRVHSIGIGNGCSQALITGCAEKGKGEHVFITDQEDCSEKIIQLLTDSLSPVISKMKLNYDHELVESIIPNPESLPYILKNQLVNFYVTFKGQLDKPAVFSFAYEDSKNKLPYKSDIVIDPESESQSFVDRMGHFKKIRILEDSFKNNGDLADMMYFVKKVDKKAEIINESVKYQILSEFTAFICVQKELVDGQYQEIKDKGQLKVNMENPLPMQYEQDLDMMLCSSSSRVYSSSNMERRRKQACRKTATHVLPKMPAVVNDRSKPMAVKHMCQSKDTLVKKQKKKKKSQCIQQRDIIQMPNSESDNLSSSNCQTFDENEIEIKPLKFAANEQTVSIKREKMQYSKNINKNDIILENNSKNNDKSSRRGGSFVPNNGRPSTTAGGKVKHSEIPIITKGDVKAKPNYKKIQNAEEKREKQIEYSSFTTFSADISNIIAQQSTQGCWKELTLISLLFGKDVLELVSKSTEKIAVITYLIAKWIELKHPQKQYSLVVKKGLKYAAKYSHNFQQLQTSYGPLIKA